MRVFPIAFLVLSCLLPLSSQAQALEFLPCPDASEPSLQGSVCSAVAQPLAYGQAVPEGLAEARVTIFVRKFPAHGTPKGAVWLIAGGPGESGASLYPFLPALRRSFPGLDLLIPDHRGTGQSSRLCPAEESVGSPGGTALSGAEWGSCFGRLNAQPELARQFTITHAALDLRHLVASTTRDLPTYIYGVPSVARAGICGSAASSAVAPASWLSMALRRTSRLAAWPTVPGVWLEALPTAAATLVEEEMSMQGISAWRPRA